MKAQQVSKVTIANDYLPAIYSLIAIIILIPCLKTVVAFALLWWLEISWLEVSLLLSMYALSMIGIEVGLQRYFSHQTFG